MLPKNFTVFLTNNNIFLIISLISTCLLNYNILRHDISLLCLLHWTWMNTFFLLWIHCRLYLVNSPVVRADNLRFKEEGVRDVVKDVFLPWYNAYRFLMQNVERLQRV